MKTYKRICIQDFEISAKNSDHFEIKRGKEYFTSEEKDGEVVVFTNFWCKVPIEYFAGAIIFTT